MNHFPWFIPSFFGDIKLERVDTNVTTVRAYELTPTEEAAMKALRSYALSSGTVVKRKPWAKEEDFAALEGGPYRTKDGVTITLQAPIEKVQRILAKEMKPARKLLDAIVFEDGSMKEVAKATTGEAILPPANDETKKKPKAAVTVASPTIGCPIPEFPEEEIRATRVLETFLDKEQLRDYRHHGVVMARGIDTGHQYAITHRGRKTSMAHVSFRSLYDMTDNRPLCVHDWTVPPPEEMLTLLLCVSLPGKESYIRHLPEALL